MGLAPTMSCLFSPAANGFAKGWILPSGVCPWCPIGGRNLTLPGDDAAKETLKSLASECGVTDRVIFGGFRKDVPIALASSDIFLFPSWYEAFSLATIEAAACGLPIVATSINGTEDFIQPGITGEFVKSDPKHIAQVIDPLIQNAQKRTEMGQNARRLVEQNYTWDRVTEATESAYKEYLSSRNSKET